MDNTKETRAAMLDQVVWKDFVTAGENSGLSK